MKIAGMADLHGHLNHTSPPDTDVLAIVGDIVPLMSSAEDWKQWQELQWVERKFVRWLRRQLASIRCFYRWLARESRRWVRVDDSISVAHTDPSHPASGG